MLGKLIVEGATVELPWFDPNTLNLVAEVSTKVIVTTITTSTTTTTININKTITITNITFTTTTTNITTKPPLHFKEVV